MREVKIIWGEKYLLLHFHYFIYLETANTQNSKVFLLWISSGNVNASRVVSCQYPQIHWKGLLEKLNLLCLLRKLLWKSVPLAAYIFQTVIVIVVIKILEKYFLNSSALVMNF